VGGVPGQKHVGHSTAADTPDNLVFLTQRPAQFGALIFHSIHK
jgi:hypothetical protein